MWPEGYLAGKNQGTRTSSALCSHTATFSVSWRKALDLQIPRCQTAATLELYEYIKKDAFT